MDIFLRIALDFFVSYLVVFLIYVLIINRKRKTYKTGKRDGEISFFITKYKLDMQKTNYKTVLMTLTVINSFIITFTATLVIYIDKLIWQILVGFAVLFILIYSLYEIAGRIFKRKEDKKDV